METGTLFGISIGTGDPELITVKALRILQSCKVVAFPSGVNNRSGIAQRIIQSWLHPQQELLPLDFPYIKSEIELKAAWHKAAEKVWQYLNQGVDICFACLGDISFYSTFTYLAQTIQVQHPMVKIVTVPGVCSPMAIASVLGIPLTVSQQRLAILPAMYSIQELEKTLSWAEVVVLLKVNSVYEQVWQILQQRNLLSTSCIVEKVTFPEQKVYRDLTNYPRLNLSYFSIMLIKTQF